MAIPDLGVSKGLHVLHACQHLSVGVGITAILWFHILYLPGERIIEVQYPWCWPCLSATEEEGEGAINEHAIIALLCKVSVISSYEGVLIGHRRNERLWRAH